MNYLLPDKVSEFVDQSNNNFLNKVISIHFDDLDLSHENAGGLELLELSCNILTASIEYSKASDCNSDRRLLIYIPLISSNEIKFWHNAMWGEIGKDFEPPSLYSLIGDIFEIDCEEYRCPVNIPQSKHDFLAIYRSFKCSSRPGANEYTNGIYLLDKS